MILRRGFVPLAEIVRGVTIELARDRVFEAWAEYEPDLRRIPPPSTFAALRAAGASDDVMVRLVRLLAWEGHLGQYGRGDRFAELVGYHVARGAA